MQDAPETAGSQALVPLSDGRSGMPARPRLLAGFVAQLLACHLDAPAYRARRRAAPETAVACYGAAPAHRASCFERWL